MLLAIMGPGLIVMVGDNAASGVATYAQAGENYGLPLRWTLLLLIPGERGEHTRGARPVHDPFTTRSQQPLTHEGAFMNMLSWSEFVLRLGAAVLIGLDRRWRSRGAGHRTNTLGAAGSAMFVPIARMTAHQTSFDPTRVTSYVVSGVGFLGRGVIISDGVSVRGINTAAALWCAAAGALLASGFMWQAGVATAAILAINILLRPLGRRIDRQPVDEDTEIGTTYRLRATTRDQSEAHARALLLQSISGHGYQLSGRSRAPISTTPTSSTSKPSSPPLAATTNRSRQPPAASGWNPTSHPSAGR